MSKSTKPKKRILVSLHGHDWPVYPCKTRDTTIYRVFHRVNGERKPKTFMALADAKTDAKNILKEIYGRAASKIHLTEDEKRDWKAAMDLLKSAGLKCGLETAIRHYGDLVKIVGHEGLLTDVARKYAESRGKTGTPVKLATLRDEYLSALKTDGCSKRHIEAQRSHTGQFFRHIGGAMSDLVTRESIQAFIDSKKAVDPRTKKNLLDAIKAMMAFGKSKRYVPRDWEEAEHVSLPAIKPKEVKIYTAEELKKLLIAAPERYRHILALAAFTGIRSSELEALDWKHIRLMEDDPADRLIVLDLDVTEEASKRTIQITDQLYGIICGPYKTQGKLWTGTHDEFYLMQQKIAKAAGVVWKQNALRHTCISAKVAVTKDVPQVAYESGNSVAMIKKHYLSLMTQTAAKEWFAIDRETVFAGIEERKKALKKTAATPIVRLTLTAGT